MKKVILCLLSLTLFLGSVTGDVFAAAKGGAAPKITKALLVRDNQVKLQWSRVKAATKYKVYRKKDNGRFVLIRTTSGRTCYDRNLAFGTTYTYKVKAIRKNKSARTSKLKKVHTRPAKPVMKVNGRGRYGLVRWKKAKGAVRYKVYRKKVGGKFVLVRTTTRRYFLDKKLAYDTIYVYRVKAVSVAGKTKISNEKRLRTGKKVVIPAQPKPPDTPVEPEEPGMPLEPDTPDQPEEPVEPELPEEPDPPVEPEPEVPEEPMAPEPDQPEKPEPEPEPEPPEKTVTVMIPIYAEDTVYWIKSIATGEILYQTTDAASFEAELLTRPDPDTWHWGSGGITMITGYEVITMTESEWAESWYNGRSDVIIIESQGETSRSC